jgi:hypothetical protein
MSAPANDDLANATVITGLSSSLTSTNTDATTETGEPGWPLNAMSGGHAATPEATVWYSWTCPAIPSPNISGLGPTYYEATDQGEFLFSTDSLLTTFQSTLQIFTSSITGGGTPTIASLTEVGVNLDERVGCNCGAANGARLSFIAVVGTTYYIRVGGRNNAQGNFNLSWGEFDMMTLGSCAHCGPTTSGPQIGTYQLPITVGGSQSFTLPAGAYSVAYCKGAFIWDAVLPYWVVATGEGGFGVTSITFPDGTVQNINNEGADSAGSTRLNAECLIYPDIPFVTCGGTLTFTFSDTDYTDNITPGTTPPIFQLVEAGQFPSPFITPAGCGSDNWAGPTTFTVNFSWENTGFPINNPVLTATLLNTGGVSGGYSHTDMYAQTGSGSANNATFTFTADIYNSFCTATIELTMTACPSVVVATLEYPLYPIIALSFGDALYSGSCSPSGTYKQGSLTAVIGGPAAITSAVAPVGTATSSVVPLVNASCVVQSSVDVSDVFDGSTVYLNFQGQGTTTATDLHIATTWGTLTLPAFDTTVNVP